MEGIIHYPASHSLSCSKAPKILPCRTQKLEPLNRACTHRVLPVLFVLIIQTNELRFREAKSLPQGHTAGLAGDAQTPACYFLLLSASLSPHSPMEGVSSGFGDIWQEVTQFLLGEFPGLCATWREVFGPTEGSTRPGRAQFTPPSLHLRLSPSCLVRSPANCPLHTLSLLACLSGEKGNHILFWAFPFTPELRVMGILGLFGGPLCRAWPRGIPPALGDLPNHWIVSLAPHCWEQCFANITS